MKTLLSHLKYAYLNENFTLPMIISIALATNEEERLLRIIREYKIAFGWLMVDMKGIISSVCMHKLLIEENYRPLVEHQRRLNPNMKEVMRKKVIKWLDAGIIYLISDSQWVSPIQVMLKKGEIIVLPNDNKEVIP